jgi:hypothetical protein
MPKSFRLITDPIFAAIEAHRAAEAAYASVLAGCRTIEEEHEREAEANRLSDIEQRALAALAATVPTTRKGAFAFLSYLSDVERDSPRLLWNEDGTEQGFFFDVAVSNIRSALFAGLLYEGDDPDPGEEYDNDNGDAELADAVAA